MMLLLLLLLPAFLVYLTLPSQLYRLYNIDIRFTIIISLQTVAPYKYKYIFEVRKSGQKWKLVQMDNYQTTYHTAVEKRFNADIIIKGSLI